MSRTEKVFRLLVAERGTDGPVGLSGPVEIDDASAYWRAAHADTGGTTLLDPVAGHDATLSGGAKELAYAGVQYAFISAVIGNRFSTPLAFSPTDLQVEFEASIDDYSTVGRIAAHQTSAGSGDRQFWIYASAGDLNFAWAETDGTSRVVSFTIPFATSLKKLWKVTLDVDDGAGGHVARAYHRDSEDDDWEQFGGDQNAGAFTTSIRSSTATVTFGGISDRAAAPGKYYRMWLYDGIGGALVASPDITDTSAVGPGSTSLTDSVGVVWTINRSASGFPLWIVDADLTLYDGSAAWLKVLDHDDLDFGAADSFTVLAVLRTFDPSVSMQVVRKCCPGYSLFFDGFGNLEFVISDLSLAPSAQLAAPAAGSLATVAGVRDTSADTVEAFVDGVGSGPSTDTTTGTLASGQDVNIGRRENGTQHFRGAVYGATIVPSALTGAEQVQYGKKLQGFTYLFQSEIGDAPDEVPSPMVEPLSAKTITQRTSIKVIDASEVVSAELGDADGRMNVLGRIGFWQESTNDGDTWTTLLTGRIADLQSPEPTHYIFGLDDERWAERHNTIFTSANTANLYPPGLKSRYGLIPAVRDATFSVRQISGDDVQLRIVHPPDSQPELSQALLDLLESDVATTAERGGGPGHFTSLRANLDGTDYEVVTFGQTLTGADRPVKTLGPAGIATLWVYIPGHALNVDNELTGYLHMPGAEATEANPLHIGGESGVDPFQLVKDIYDLTYGGDVAVRYDTSLFTAWDPDTNPAGLIDRPDTPRLRIRITKAHNMAEWLERHIYSPLGYVPFVDSQGRVAPRRVRMPENLDPNTLFVFDASTTKAPYPTWDHNSEGAVTALLFDYVFERALSKHELEEDDDWPADRIRVIERGPHPETHDNIEKLGRREHRYDVSAYPTWFTLAQATKRDIFDRVGDGPIDGTIYGTTAAEAVQSGDFVIIDADSLKTPNQGVNARSGRRIVQILQKRRLPIGFAFAFQDMGPDAVILTAPTVSLAQNGTDPEHTVDATISGLTSGLGYKLYIDRGDGSGFQPEDIGTQNETRQVIRCPSGTEIKARVQATARGRIRSDFSAEDSVTTASLSAPTGLSTTVHDRSIALEWTNGESDYPVMPTLNGVEQLDTPLPSGSDVFEFEELAASTQHTLGVKHVDEYGGESALTTVQDTTSTAATLAAPKSLQVVQGRTAGVGRSMPDVRGAEAIGVELAWTPGEIHARTRLQASTDPAFGTIEQEFVLVPGRSRFVVELGDGKLDSTERHFRVRTERTGFDDSPWSSVVSSFITAVLPGASLAADKFPSGWAYLELNADGTVDLHVGGGDPNTERVYYEVSKAGFPTVDDTDSSVAAEDFPEEVTGVATLSGGETAFLTARFWSQTTLFGQTVRHDVGRTTKRPPTVGIRPWQDTDPDPDEAVLDVNVEDPDNTLTRVLFKGSSEGTVDLSDPADGTWSEDAAPYSGRRAFSNPDHSPIIAAAVGFDLGDGQGERFLGPFPHTFDRNVRANVRSVELDFEADGTLVANVIGDEDLRRDGVNPSFLIAVGEDAGPTGAKNPPDEANNDGTLTLDATDGTSGVIVSSVQITAGQVAHVIVRAVNKQGVLGPPTEVLKKRRPVEGGQPSSNQAQILSVTWNSGAELNGGFKATAYTCDVKIAVGPDTDHVELQHTLPAATNIDQLVEQNDVTISGEGVREHTIRVKQEAPSTDDEVWSDGNEGGDPPDPDSFNPVKFIAIPRLADETPGTVAETISSIGTNFSDVLVSEVGEKGVAAQDHLVVKKAGGDTAGNPGLHWRTSADAVPKHQSYTTDGTTEKQWLEIDHAAEEMTYGGSKWERIHYQVLDEGAGSSLITMTLDGRNVHASGGVGLYLHRPAASGLPLLYGFATGGDPGDEEWAIGLDILDDASGLGAADFVLAYQGRAGGGVTSGDLFRMAPGGYTLHAPGAGTPNKSYRFHIVGGNAGSGDLADVLLYLQAGSSGNGREAETALIVNDEGIHTVEWGVAGRLVIRPFDSAGESFGSGLGNRLRVNHINSTPESSPAGFVGQRVTAAGDVTAQGFSGGLTVDLPSGTLTAGFALLGQGVMSGAGTVEELAGLRGNVGASASATGTVERAVALQADAGFDLSGGSAEIKQYAGVLIKEPSVGSEGRWALLSESLQPVEISGHLRHQKPPTIVGGMFADVAHFFPDRLGVGRRNVRSRAVLDVGERSNSHSLNVEGGVYGVLFDVSIEAGATPWGHMFAAAITAAGTAAGGLKGEINTFHSTGGVTIAEGLHGRYGHRGAGTVGRGSGLIGTASIDEEATGDVGTLNSIFGNAPGNFSATAAVANVYTAQLRAYQSGDSDPAIGTNRTVTLLLWDPGSTGGFTPTGTNTILAQSGAHLEAGGSAQWVDAPSYSWLKTDYQPVDLVETMGAIRALQLNRYRTKDTGRRGIGPNIDELPDPMRIRTDGIAPMDFAVFALAGVQYLDAAHADHEARIAALEAA